MSEKSYHPGALISLCIALLAVPIIEIAYHDYINSKVPTDDDWLKARQIIEQAYEEEDLVEITPWWATEGWVYLGKFTNIKKRARDDARGWGRIWEVAWAGRGRKYLRDNAKLIMEKNTGRLVVRLWLLPDAPKTIFDFVEGIETAKVQMTDLNGKVIKQCNFVRNSQDQKSPDLSIQTGKFKCNPAKPWNYVAREVIADLQNKPRLCIWSHPVTNQRVRITFESVPDAKVIEGYTGLKYEADREGAGKPPVYMDIFADGNFVGKATHTEGAGWSPYKFLLPENWHGGQIRFEVYTPFDGMQHFCWSAKLRDK